MPQMKLKSSGHRNGKPENQSSAKNSLRSSSQLLEFATANKLDNTLTSPRLRRKLPRNSVKSDSSIISSREKNDVLSHNNLLTAKINNKNNSKFDLKPNKKCCKKQESTALSENGSFAISPVRSSKRKRKENHKYLELYELTVSRGSRGSTPVSSPVKKLPSKMVTVKKNSILTRPKYTRRKKASLSSETSWSLLQEKETSARKKLIRQNSSLNDEQYTDDSVRSNVLVDAGRDFSLKTSACDSVSLSDHTVVSPVVNFDSKHSSKTYKSKRTNLSKHLLRNSDSLESAISLTKECKSLTAKKIPRQPTTPLKVHNTSELYQFIDCSPILDDHSYFQCQTEATEDHSYSVQSSPTTVTLCSNESTMSSMYISKTNSCREIKFLANSDEKSDNQMLVTPVKKNKCHGDSQFNGNDSTLDEVILLSPFPETPTTSVRPNLVKKTFPVESSNLKMNKSEALQPANLRCSSGITLNKVESLFRHLEMNENEIKKQCKVQSSNTDLNVVVDSGLVEPESFKLDSNCDSVCTKIDEARDQKHKVEPTVVRRLLKSPKKVAKDNPTERKKAVYNPRQWNHPVENQVDYQKKGMITDETKKANTILSKEKKEVSTVSHTVDPPLMGQIDSWSKRAATSDNSDKITVSKDLKPLFTVVHNVKDAYECHEYGETQEFEDDIDYMMDGLKDTQSQATRCLSTTNLASKCLMPAFRMHLRAHGILTRVLVALEDAKSDSSLALCLSAILFTMSQDRLAFELDEFCLKLIIKLATSQEARSPTDDGISEEERHRIVTRLHDVCNKAICHNKTSPRPQLSLKDITVQHLAMETLLSMASRSTTSADVKSLFRNYGGMELTARSVNESIADLTKMSKTQRKVQNKQLYLGIEHRLKVLENMSHMCVENQQFLLQFQLPSIVGSLNSLVIACIETLTSGRGNVPKSEEKFGVEETKMDGDMGNNCVFADVCSVLLNALKLLLNITHDNEVGCLSVGSEKNFLSTLFNVILVIPAAVPSSQQFDLCVLGLGLLVNIVEKSDKCRRQFLNLKTKHVATKSVSMKAFQALGSLFTKRYEAARRIEEVHDAEMDSTLTPGTTRGNCNLTSSRDVNQSGEWFESEAGLEWIVTSKPASRQDQPSDDGRPAGNSNKTPDNEDHYVKDLHNAGRHMEDSIIAAYVALLVGTIVQHQLDLTECIREFLPDRNFASMVRMLRKFLGFMNFTNENSSNGSKSIQHIISILESC